MHDDLQILEKLNMDIGTFETEGDRRSLETVIAPELAFARANADRTIDDARRYLEKVAPTDPRHTRVESIELIGDRAIVKCVVTVASTGKAFHNLRLFVKLEQRWRLLGWANEALAS